MMNVVLVKTKDCEFVGFDYGDTEHNGKKYHLVSPYSDGRPKHWLEPETEYAILCSI